MCHYVIRLPRFSIGTVIITSLKTDAHFKPEMFLCSKSDWCNLHWASVQTVESSRRNSRNLLERDRGRERHTERTRGLLWLYDSLWLLVKSEEWRRTEKQARSKQQMNKCAVLHTRNARAHTARFNRGSRQPRRRSDPERFTHYY